MVEVWSTAAVIMAVLEALLDDPEKLASALRALGASPISEAARRARPA